MNAPFDLQRFLEQMTNQLDQTTQWWPDDQMPFQARQRFPIDLSEQAEEFVVTAELPGFDRDEIELRLTDQTLWIEAHHEESEHEEDTRKLRQERRSMQTQRSLRLPEPIDPDATEATLHNGVLTITIPKAHHEEDSRSIEIE